MIFIFLALFCDILFNNVYFVMGTPTAERCLVRTNYGLLHGKFMASRSGEVFCAFLGVPFASPPTGQLRFLPPQSPEKWEGVRNATVEGVKCLQKLTVGSEDCLFLNIFTQNPHAETLNPVMAYIHGGGFHMGSSSMDVYGPEYMMDKDIVLVTLQYRLGVFGFLSTGDEIIPGNMGLKDQVKALEWIKENIRFFGGNPDLVTIFGISAGASSVHFHMFSPLSKNLFVRAISQSGTGLSSYAITTRKQAKQDTETLAADLNCEFKNSTQLLICLQNKSSSEIMNSFMKQLISKYGVNKSFRAVIEPQTENAFITDSPLKASTDKPWLVGVTANEGLLKIEIDRLAEILNSTHSNFTTFGPKLMFISDLYTNTEEVASSVYNFYLKNATTTNETIIGLEQMTSDSWFTWPTEQAIHQHKGPLYYYLYDHVGEHSFAEVYNFVRGFGVAHMDELIVLFKQNKYFPKLNEIDSNISKFMINCWVNFATTGNPTPNPISKNPQSKDSRNFEWEILGSDFSFIHIQTNSLSMEKGMFSKRMQFWQSLPKMNLEA